MNLAPALSLAAHPRCFGCRSPGAWLCAACSRGLQPPRRTDPIEAVDRFLIPWAYEGAARDLILALKLRARRPAAEVLAAALARAIRASGISAQAITWVPGRRKEIRARGFDHAALIARHLGDHTGLEVVPLLHRAADRPDQTTLSADARRTNLTGAFVARSAAERVLLVDDLVTTGSTASACARALRDSGTTHVEVAAPCRA